MAPFFCLTRSKAVSQDDHESDLADSISRHSSIRGPYRRGVIDLHFPTYEPISRPFVECTTYSCSLMSSGNGFAPFRIDGTMNRPQKHFKQGISIGDVGYLDGNGRFNFCFNIFCTADDPIQTDDLPRNFTPIQPPLSEWEVRRIPDYFPPGAVVASEGIQVDRTSESPLKLQFTTTAREGAVAVFPTGGFREDLVDPSKMHAYIKRHAVDWYQNLNGYGGTGDALPSPPMMNGMVYVVTGSDRATSWATATFPFSAMDAGALHEFTYKEDDPDVWWGSTEPVRGRHKTESDSQGTLYAIFIRGITIALGTPSWTRCLPIIPVDEVPCYLLLSKPLFERPKGRFARFAKRLEGPETASGPPALPIMFHPAIILLEILINTAPPHEVALLDDSIWCTMLDGRNPTQPELIKLIQRIIKTHNVVVTDGIATLVKKAEHEQVDKTPSSSRFSFFKPYWETWFAEPSFDEKALRILHKVLSRHRSL